MENNDEKIKNLLSEIEKKKEELGVKPRGSWKTNGVICGKNINTINLIDTLIEFSVSMLNEKSCLSKACEWLEVPELAVKSNRAKYINNALDDLKLRSQMLKYDAKKKNLSLMENRLKDLRSEDLKTADAISKITKDLDL